MVEPVPRPDLSLLVIFSRRELLSLPGGHAGPEPVDGADGFACSAIAASTWTGAARSTPNSATTQPARDDDPPGLDTDSPHQLPTSWPAYRERAVHHSTEAPAAQVPISARPLDDQRHRLPPQHRCPLHCFPRCRSSRHRSRRILAGVRTAAPPCAVGRLTRKRHSEGCQGDPPGGRALDSPGCDAVSRRIAFTPRPVGAAPIARTGEAKLGDTRPAPSIRDGSIHGEAPRTGSTVASGGWSRLATGRSGVRPSRSSSVCPCVYPPRTVGLASQDRFRDGLPRRLGRTSRTGRTLIKQPPRALSTALEPDPLQDQ
ncbi:hypothetical protein Ae707Ps1_5925 [Pseudonocardia sp. Ae707_Ps1]|nr:hypothetical protein Ae707Ps1_5925 [Pseudonocardia sp. Ae707_Ps1]